MPTYYDGTKLLSMLDINGNKPEIYICTSNRTAGKTTYFSKMLVNKFLSKGEKFCLLYRYKYELNDAAEKFFNGIASIFFSKFTMQSKSKASGIYHELILNGGICGYALSINSADKLKSYSHLFNDVNSILFDEFQSETGRYCSNEIAKFISIHTSIARGKGKQTRYVPVYMCSNFVSLLNPYYAEMGISERLTSETKFLRGDGYVLEQNYNESASKSQLSSSFNRALSSNKYVAYSSQNVYLNDSENFIENPTGKSNYMATIIYNGKNYSIREYSEIGIIYCDTSYDYTYPFKIAVTTADHNINYVMLAKNSMFISQLKFYFEKGCFRFKNLKCKEAIIKLLSI